MLAPLMRPILFALFSTLSLLGAADPSTKNYHLRDFNLGNHLTGPRVTEGALKGKAVAIVCMGTLSGNRNSWAAAWTPEFEELHEAHGKKVTVIGSAWSKGLVAKDLAEYAKKFKIEFTIQAGIEHAPFEVPHDGHCLLFNAEGKLIYSGTPNKGNADFKAAIKAITE